MGLGKIVKKHGYRVRYTKELKDFISYIESETDKNFLGTCCNQYLADISSGEHMETLDWMCENYSDGKFSHSGCLLHLITRCYDGETFEDSDCEYFWMLENNIFDFEEYGYITITEEDYLELVSNTVSEDEIESVAAQVMEDMLFEDEALHCNLLSCGLDEKEFSCLVETLKEYGIDKDLEIQEWVMEAVGLKNDALKGDKHDSKHLCLVSKDCVGKHIERCEVFEGYTIVGITPLSNLPDIYLAYQEFDDDECYCCDEYDDN